MKLGLQKMVVWLGAVFLLVSTVRTDAFALLGPYEPWMQATNDLRQPGYITVGSFYGKLEDIGGPMDLTSEYRWNVPVITYEFDQSFLDYFGTNGVAAVTSAIQVLNDLPSASQMVLTNYPSDSQRRNFAAQAQNLYDLKSETLSLLLEQMGFANPTRYVFVLRQWDSVFIPQYGNTYSVWFYWPDWVYPDFIARRNFDPQTFDASFYVNNTQIGAYIVSQGNQNYMIPYQVDPIANIYTAIADFNLNAGSFYTGLTYDDVGGLAYLLSTNNVNFENLLPGVYGVGANSNSLVNGAWRPGVDKITFVLQPVDSSSGNFLAYTNQFTDSYLTNGVLVQQQVARVMTKPDILFSVEDFAAQSSNSVARRTGTTNWINNASLNGNPTGAGPGVIQPGINITFNKVGRALVHYHSLADESVDDYGYSPWASFNASTNVPVVYPAVKTGTNQFTIRMWLTFGKSLQQHFEWSPVSLAGTQFAFQTSTNLINWTTSFVVINDGNVCTYFNDSPASQRRFYRLISQ